MNIVIEKNIPLPPKRGGTKYPFSEMKSGDSFTVDSYTERMKVLSSFYFQKNSGKISKKAKIASREIEDGKYRVWMVVK